VTEEEVQFCEREKGVMIREEYEIHSTDLMEILDKEMMIGASKEN
jgi:hypothetical protein